MPEPVNSVVIGDPEHFQAEHSEHEPELVTIKPVSAEPMQTNLLITTTLGHQANLVLISSGQQSGGTQTVDLLLKYGKPTEGSFLVEEGPVFASLVAETQRLDGPAKLPELVSTGPQMTSATGPVKAASSEGPSGADEKPVTVLDKLLDRQKRASLPILYGQHPGRIDAGPRIKAGVSEVLDEGQDVVVLFSAVNPANHAIEILPPQVQLEGKVKKVDHRGAVARDRFPIEHSASGCGAGRMDSWFLKGQASRNRARRFPASRRFGCGGSSGAGANRFWD